MKTATIVKVENTEDGNAIVIVDYDNDGKITTEKVSIYKPSSEQYIVEAIKNRGNDILVSIPNAKEIIEEASKNLEGTTIKL